MLWFARSSKEGPPRAPAKSGHNEAKSSPERIRAPGPGLGARRLPAGSARRGRRGAEPRPGASPGARDETRPGPARGVRRAPGLLRGSGCKGRRGLGGQRLGSAGGGDVRGRPTERVGDKERGAGPQLPNKGFRPKSSRTPRTETKPKRRRPAGPPRLQTPAGPLTHRPQPLRPPISTDSVLPRPTWLSP